MQYILNEKEVKNESKEMHVWKCVAVFLIGWFGLSIAATLLKFFLMVFQSVPFNEAIRYIILEDVTQSVVNALGHSWVNITINTVAYITVAAAMILLLNKDFIIHIKSFKNGKAILAGFIGYILLIVFNVVYHNLVDPLYPVSDNLNEASLDSVIILYPLISTIIFGFVGPVCEELTYRVGLFSFLKKKSKALAYVITILFFAFIHFAFESIFVLIDSGDGTWLINELLNMPTYMFAAAVFTYLFDNFGFAGSTSAHIFNNFISVITQIIVSKL